MNVYLDQDRGNETERAIEELREIGCGFVDDIFVVNDKDAEAVCLFFFNHQSETGLMVCIDIRSKRRKNGVFVYGRLDMAL